jgi:hypothetical protein
LISNLVFIFDANDLDTIPESILNDSKNKIFSFSSDTHKILSSKKLNYELADNILNKNDRLEIFDKCLDYFSWDSEIPSNDLVFEGVNLLKLFDSHELHSLLMPILINFITIKRIIEKEKPSEIVCSNISSKFIQSLVQNTEIKIQIFKNTLKNDLLWDNISINYNIGKIPLSLNLSKKNYLTIKKFTESIMGLSSNFWLDCKTSKKSIVLLEFNTELFSNLLDNLKNYDGNIILVNQRRSALWSKKAINTVKKSNCKILNSDKVLTKNDKKKISQLTEEYSKKFNFFWNNPQIFENFFQIEGLSFWDIIKDTFVKSYDAKLFNFISIIQTMKILFESVDIRCIVSLNEVGETEKAFLEYNKNKIPSIVLEHGFVERDSQTKLYDKKEYLQFRDKLGVWGNSKKNFMIDEYAINSSKIIVTGSPRHDDFFNSRLIKKQSKEITVLLAPNPITQISGLSNSDLELKFENTIRKIILILKEFKNCKLIVKLHASQLPHNKKIKSLINQIDSNIPVYQSVPVIDTINRSDIVIVVSPESFGTSTMLLESMILRKPTMNIILDKDIPDYNHIKQNAVYTISYCDNLVNCIKKMLFDKQFQNEITQNAEIFVSNFLAYPGYASKEFSKILKSF